MVKNSKPQTPEELILDKIDADFKQWLKKRKGIKATYSFKPAFDDLEKMGATWVEVNFLSLLPALLVNGRKDDVKRLIGFIGCTICKFEWKRNKGQRNGSMDNRKTSLKSFLTYVSSKKKWEKLLGPSSLKLSEEDEEKLKKAFKNRIIYSHGDLRTKFKSRLRCQDRTSGDKIWLPVRFISSIYTHEKSNEFNDWLDSLVDNVFIHYLELDEITVKHATFEKKQLYLELIRETDEEEYAVNVVLSEDMRYGKWYPALTPTGKGNNKELMIVDCIDSIAIDHVKPIDQTLKDKEKELPNLKIVSDIYKSTISPTVKMLKENAEFSLQGLTKELYIIRDDGPLRLMASKYNSQKSNGRTFQEILEVDKVTQTHWGILEWEQEIVDEAGDRYYYYQELTNTIVKNKFRIRKRKPAGKPVKGRRALENIIDKI